AEEPRDRRTGTGGTVACSPTGRVREAGPTVHRGVRHDGQRGSAYAARGTEGGTRNGLYLLRIRRTARRVPAGRSTATVRAAAARSDVILGAADCRDGARASRAAEDPALRTATRRRGTRRFRHGVLPFSGSGGRRHNAWLPARQGRPGSGRRG